MNMSITAARVAYQMLVAYKRYGADTRVSMFNYAGKNVVSDWGAPTLALMAIEQAGALNPDLDGFYSASENFDAVFVALEKLISVHDECKSLGFEIV